jgi:hypothetical protein
MLLSNQCKSAQMELTRGTIIPSLVPRLQRTLWSLSCQFLHIPTFAPPVSLRRQEIWSVARSQPNTITFGKEPLDSVVMSWPQPIDTLSTSGPHTILPIYVSVLLDRHEDDCLESQREFTEGSRRIQKVFSVGSWDLSFYLIYFQCGGFLDINILMYVLEIDNLNNYIGFFVN